jgi:hypothetical protein
LDKNISDLPITSKAIGVRVKVKVLCHTGELESGEAVLFEVCGLILIP